MLIYTLFQLLFLLPNLGTGQVLKRNKILKFRTSTAVKNVQYTHCYKQLYWYTDTYKSIKHFHWSYRDSLKKHEAQTEVVAQS